jgi:tetratricopeptide (TPR) repeat protein
MLFFLLPVYSQQSREKALACAKAAIRMEDEGKTEEAIALLRQAISLDSSDIDYRYELAYAYSSLKAYDTALVQISKLLDQKNANDLLFELAGNCWQQLGNKDKAAELFDAGLKRFPDSGRLHYEKGLLELSAKEYNRALVYFEKGIEQEPGYAGNYYWAAKLFSHSTEPVWGMLYGELFLSLNRSSKETSEIGKLLYDTYVSSIRMNADSSFSVNFSKFSTENNADSLSNKHKLAFGTGVYEPTILISLHGEKKINLMSLARIRKKFLDSYFKSQNNILYPNVLFDYQYMVAKAGHFEAYSYWVLMEGDPLAFEIWKEKHLTAWNAFLKWFQSHPLDLSKAHRFYRAQYVHATGK